MKELSLEEKAIAYDKAIERTSKLIDEGCLNRMTGEFIFPELKESEDEDTDEKVRKALIKLVTNHASMDLFIEYDIHLYEALSWLEKQGNSHIKWNKNTKDCKPKVNHSVLMKTTQGIAEGEWQGEQWYQYRWAGIIRDTDVLSWIELSNLEKQGEQKPADKDVETKFKVCDIITPKDRGHEPWQIMQVDILDKKYRFKEGYIIHFSQEDDYELVEQKPAWSEEDRIHYNKCLQYLESISPRKEDIEWLESLKDRYTWKPSDEQIACLHDAVARYNREGFSAATLASLLEQLKKLKG